MEKPSSTPIPNSVFWLVLWSFVLQIAMIGVFREYRTRPQEDHFGFGWEMGRVARSIALGQGFSNPYGDNTGPTAWEPPLYPYLMAGVFKLFGIYTYASAWVLLTINSLFAALTTVPIFLIACKTFRRARCDLVGVGVGAQSLHLVLVDSLDLGHDLYAARTQPDLSGGPGTGRLARLARLGDIRLLVGCGRIGQSVNARVPAVLRALDLAPTIQERPAFIRRRRAVVHDFLSCCFRRGLSGTTKCLGKFVFLRDDFGLQFRLGNSKSAEGMLMAYLQPNLNKLEFEKFQRMGELAYAEDCKRIAFEWVRENPKRFARDQPEKIFLLLERRTQAHRQPCAMGLSQFVVSGVVGAGDLGSGSSRAPEGPRGMAFRGTDPDLSRRLIILYFRTRATVIPLSLNW